MINLDQFEADLDQLIAEAERRRISMAATARLIAARGILPVIEASRDRDR